MSCARSEPLTHNLLPAERAAVAKSATEAHLAKADAAAARQAEAQARSTAQAAVDAAESAEEALAEETARFARELAAAHTAHEEVIPHDCFRARARYAQIR